MSDTKTLSTRAPAPAVPTPAVPTPAGPTTSPVAPDRELGAAGASAGPLPHLGGRPDGHGRGLTIEVITGEAARDLLRDEAFLNSWSALHARCPWATVFQARGFVETWYAVYGDVYDPVIVSGYAPDGSVSGLLLLAADTDRRRLHVAGAHQCEYQAWLSLPEYGDAFPDAALEALSVRFPGARLKFLYLAPGAPREWLAPGGRWARRTLSHGVLRALRDLEGTSDASLRKKGNKARLNQLKRLGEVSFERITSRAAFVRLMDDFIPIHDFRQAAVNGVAPFAEDPRKRLFHERLFDVPDFLYVTVLRCGGRLVAAQIGVREKGVVSLGPHTFAPEFYRQSPGKLLVHMLSDVASADGVTTLDMTPGPGWKERFATRTDTCDVVEVFFSAADRARVVSLLERDALAKRIALRLGTTPDAVREQIDNLRRHGLFGSLTAGLRKLTGVRRWISDRAEMDLFTMSPAEAGKIGDAFVAACTPAPVADGTAEATPAAQPAAPALPFRVNSLEDLLRFEPSADWQCRTTFLSTAMERMGNGDRVYTLVEDGVLAAWGWLSPDQTRSRITEVGQEVVLPGGSAVLYDFYTDPRHRGRGHQTRCLRQALGDAARLSGVKYVWIGVRPQNTPAYHNVVKLGFRRHSRLSRSSSLGRTEHRTGKKALHVQPSRLASVAQTVKRGILHLAKWTGGFAAARSLTADEVRVLCWHGWEIEGESDFAPRLFMKRETFARRLDLLVRGRYRVIPLDQAVDGLAGGPLPRLPVVLTIDDGAASTALVAAKELEERGLPSTLYVTTYHVDRQGPVFRVALRYLLWKTPAETVDLAGIGPFTEGSLNLADEGAVETAYWVLVRHAEEELSEAQRQALGAKIAERLGLDWEDMVRTRRCSLTTRDELRRLAEHGMDLQLHTHRHRFPADEAVVRREIEQNRRALSRILPVRFDHLCYPNNEYDPVQFPWLRELGVRSGTTCDVGLNPKGTDPFRIRRFLDGECVREIEFEAEMSGFNEVCRRVLAKFRRR